MRIRATLRLRNEAMLAAREALGLTQKALADQAGVPLATVAAFERMDYTGRRVWEKAREVALVLGQDLGLVLPPECAGQAHPHTFVRVAELEPSQLESLHRSVMRKLPGPSEALEAKELASVVRQALSDLTYREREILAMRYGLGDDGYTYTLEEVARIFEVTRERVGQVERKALGKLQRGEEGVKLRQHVGVDRWGRVLDNPQIAHSPECPETPE